MPTVTVTMPIQAGRPGISCRIGMAIRAATTGTAERNNYTQTDQLRDPAPLADPDPAEESGK